MIRRSYRVTEAKCREEGWVIVETRPNWTGWDVVGTFREWLDAEMALEAIEKALDRFMSDNDLAEGEKKR